MQPYRFKKEEAVLGHGDTILAAPVFPEDIELPFHHAWGYIEDGNAMEAHRHSHPEVYIITSGEGVMELDGETFAVKSGDVVHIRPDALHTIRQQGGPALQWAAFWWE